MNGNGETTIQLQPVEKTVEVGLELEEAFRLFTEGIGSWWPLHTHSVGLDDAQTCVLEGRVGGGLYEIQADGTHSTWGTVLAWEPPHRLTLTWHPGRAADTAQELEIRFREIESGTEVWLSHRNWEKLGPTAEEAREEYVSGWDHVLGFYLNSA